MKIQKTVLSVACLWMTVCTVQTMARARRSNSPPAQPSRTDPRNLRELTGEQKATAINKSTDAFFEQREKAAQEHDRIMRAESWKWALKIHTQQWKKIEPILDKILVLSRATDCGARGWGFSKSEQRFHWRKHSEGQDLTKTNTPNVVIERNKIADELIDLLEDETSKDEDIQKKMDELQQIKERVCKELAEVKKELAALPMTARQEAALLVTCRID